MRTISLDASGVTTLSKAEAQKRIDEAMNPGSSYMRGDKEAGFGTRRVALPRLLAFGRGVLLGGSSCPSSEVSEDTLGRETSRDVMRRVLLAGLAGLTLGCAALVQDQEAARQVWEARDAERAAECRRVGGQWAAGACQFRGP